jgi:hypothetical protein
MQLNAIALQLDVKKHNSLPHVKQETNIVTHGKFVDFHSSTWMKIIQLKWNYLTTNVNILVTKKQLIGN